jgi:hypothetical protein
MNKIARPFAINHSVDTKYRSLFTSQLRCLNGTVLQIMQGLVAMIQKIHQQMCETNALNID